MKTHKIIIKELILIALFIVGIIILPMCTDSSTKIENKVEPEVGNYILDSVTILDNGSEIHIYKDTITNDTHEILF